MIHLFLGLAAHAHYGAVSAVVVAGMSVSELVQAAAPAVEGGGLCHGPPTPVFPVHHLL